MGGAMCDSCGETVPDTWHMFKPNERYDHGHAFGIGRCCVPRFERAGYSIVEPDNYDDEAPAMNDSTEKERNR